MVVLGLNLMDGSQKDEDEDGDGDGREERRDESQREEVLSTHGELSTFPSSRVRLWKLHRT